MCFIGGDEVFVSSSGFLTVQLAYINSEEPQTKKTKQHLSSCSLKTPNSKSVTILERHFTQTIVLVSVSSVYL